MLIPVSRKVYLVNCSETLTSQIKASAEQFSSLSDIIWISSPALTDEMRGYSIIFCGESFNVGTMTEDSAVILIPPRYDIGLLKNGFIDILSQPLDKDRFSAAFLNMMKLAETKRYLDLRTRLMDTYFDISSDMLWTKDLQDCHMDINHILLELSGKTREEIEGKHEREVYGLSPEDKGCSESDSYVRTTGKTIYSEESMPGADGRLHHLQVMKAAWRDGQNRIVGSVGLAKDVTALKNQQTKFVCFLNSLDLSIVIADNSGMITPVKEAYLRIMDMKEQQIIGRMADEVNTGFFHKTDTFEPGDYTVISPRQGKMIWHMENFRLKDYWGNQSGYAYVFQNVTTERLHSQQIKKMAAHDSLTNLPNRAGMYEYFETLDKSLSASFMFIDVDNFKSVNDIFGHAMGDRFLKDLAGLFRKTMKDIFVTRLGGDEFFVIIGNQYSREDVVRFADLLIKGVRNLEGYPEGILEVVSLSIGILPCIRLRNEIDEIISTCDSLMYMAKKEGKNRYYISDTEKE